MYPLLLWLWVLIVPVPAINYDPCLVTEIHATSNHSMLSVQYRATVYDKENCSAEEPKCPGVGYDHFGRNARLVADGQRDRIRRKFRLQNEGQICLMINISAVIVCGNVSSNAAPMPMLDTPRFLKKKLNDSILAIRIEPHKQARNFHVKVDKIDGSNVAERTDVETATDVIFHGNFSSPNQFVIKFKPNLKTNDRNCRSSFYKKNLGEFNEKEKVSPSVTDTDGRWIILVGAVLCIILLVGALWGIAVIRKRKNDNERNTYIEDPKIDDIALKSVLIIHTLESLKLSQEVKGLVHSLQSTCVEKVYDIFDIKDDVVLSNAEPWLIKLLCLEEQTAVIIVCSPGLMKMVKAVKRQESNTATVEVLGRQHQPFDLLLLTFLRLLCSSEYDNYYERFFAVSFENAGDSSFNKEWQIEMSDSGLPDVGWRRLYSLPSHLCQLKDALLQRDVTYASNKETGALLLRDVTSYASNMGSDAVMEGC